MNNHTPLFWCLFWCGVLYFAWLKATRLLGVIREEEG